MTSSPTSHTARMVTPSAPNAPAVIATSSARYAIPVRRRSDSATTVRGSSSLILYANQSLSCGTAWRWSASTRPGSGSSCGLPKVKSAMPGSRWWRSHDRRWNHENTCATLATIRSVRPWAVGHPVPPRLAAALLVVLRGPDGTIADEAPRVNSRPGRDAPMIRAMCEQFVARAAEPFRLDELWPLVEPLERYGIAGFGWGATWLRADGGLHSHRDTPRVPRRPGPRRLGATETTSLLVHLRRPSRLSTLQLPDTQPFVDPAGRFAFCTTATSALAPAPRAAYRAQGRIEGRADSEVGQRWLEDAWSDGRPRRRAPPSASTTAFGGARQPRDPRPGRLPPPLRGQPGEPGVHVPPRTDRRRVDRRSTPSTGRCSGTPRRAPQTPARASHDNRHARRARPSRAGDGRGRPDRLTLRYRGDGG